jgi:hypothetical protein
MKNQILKFTTIAAIAGFSFSSCNNPAKDVEKAETKLDAAQIELSKANSELEAELEKFKFETQLKIDANQQTIAIYNEQIKLEKKESQAAYKEKVEALEAKNTEMKMKIDEYKADGNENWEKFKTEFNRDMSELGDAIKNLTVKNVK